MVEIYGIEASFNGRSCEEHSTCGVLVKLDTLLRMKKVQVSIGGKEETAIACSWVSSLLKKSHHVLKFSLPRKSAGLVPRRCSNS